jgi:uncharacterized protein YegL
VSVITFGAKAEQIVPLTELLAFEEPPLQTSGAAVFGEALQLLIQCINREVRRSTATQKGDWKPLIFIMTSCQISDDWEQIAEELKKMRIGNIIACTPNSEVNNSVLKRVTEITVRLDSLVPDTLRAFFKWVSPRSNASLSRRRAETAA